MAGARGDPARDGRTALQRAAASPNEAYRRFELALAHYARGISPPPMQLYRR